MAHYDLYGNSYRTALEAYNAEMAQCNEIDMQYAQKEIDALKRQVYEQQAPTQLEYEVNILQQQISALNEKLSRYESIY